MGVEYVILVNKNDMPLGTMEKMEAHEKGALHRAFSVFVFNSDGQLMLQQRALHKYHSPGLWTNTVCSHPRVGETILDAAHRRIKEEMGFDCVIEESFSFVYKADVGKGLREHEFDHVLVGRSDLQPDVNSEEVAGWKYVNFDWLLKDVAQNPENYTVWFKIALGEMRKHRSALPIK